MARPSKANKQPVEAGPATIHGGQQKVIDVEAFQRVRDSVFARLGTIQQMLKDFSLDYLRQTNMLLGEGTDLANAPDMQTFEQALGMLPQGMPIMPLIAPVEEKKERKKRSHDPNAPKRPLTPYFLYMQTARPIIAQDLGADAPKGAVQEEGQRRWGTMNAHDKLGWDQAYQYNLRLYNARVHSYKTGNANAKHMSDDDALKYAEQFNIPMPTGKDQAMLEQHHAGNDHDAIAEQLQQHIPVEEEEETPAKTPKSAKKDSRKRKVATPAAVEADTTIQSGAAASPEKKRKRASKVTEEKEPEPKKSGRKKAKSG